MEIIKLKSVHYASFGGYTLSKDKPFIEADEKALEVLAPYIQKGFLEVKTLEEVDKKIEPVVEISIPNTEFTSTLESSIETSVKRIIEFTEDELKEKNKKELIAICEERALEFKKTFNKDELVELIIKNQ